VVNVIKQRKALRFSFDEASHEYDEARPGYPDEIIEDIIHITNIPNGGKILEVGCGTGQATIPFAKRGYMMLCLDIGKELVEIAREKCKTYANVEIHNVSFEDWETERGAFDLLISATAFHWVPQEIGYSKAATVLKDTGFIALFWNMHPTPYTGFFEDVQRIYRQVVPEWEDPRSQPRTEKRTQEWAEYINETGLFEKVQVRLYRWLRVYTTSQYLKLLDTYSDHRSLDDRRRHQLYVGIRTLLEEKYGGNVTRPYLSALYIAKKRT
jgi:SAM-dependent methyltransferase